MAGSLLTSFIKPIKYVGTSVDSYNSNSASVWVQMFGAGSAHAAIAPAQFQAVDGMNILSLQVVPIISTKDAATVFTIQENGVNTAATISLPAGGGAAVRTNTFNVRIAKNSLVALNMDTSASTTGNLAFAFVMAYR